MKQKLLIILLFLGVYCPNLQAQTRTVTGTVTDKSDGSLLPGVGVMVVGTTIGVQTNVDGKFTIQVPAGSQSLRFSYIGYLPQTVSVTGNQLSVALLSDSRQLSEIVVTGYGTQNKADNVGSVARVSGKELENRPVQSFDQALGGKAAGVQITIPNGVLNNPPVIRIRGTNSISLSSFPLIVIDGIATFTGDASGSSAAGNALSSINPNDIESIDVLKDAAAAAIYGSRAANGVLIVTTKRGKSGKATVTYDTWVGTVKPRGLEPLLDAFQYTDLKNEALRNMGTYNDGPAQTGLPRLFFALTNDANGNPINTNWYDYVYRNGFSHSNTVSVSGGSESTSFYLSGNFTAQEGIVVKNDYNRKSGLFKIDHKEGKIFELGGKISYANQENLAATSSGSLPGEAFGTGGLGRLAIVTAPNVAPYNPDGSYSIFNPTTIGRMGNVGSDVGFYNPAAVLDLDRSNNELNTIQSNFYLQANLASWLKLKTVYGIDYILSDNNSFFNPINGGSAASLGAATKSLNKNKRWVWTNTAQADYTFAEKHNVSVLLGNEQQRSESDGFNGSRTTLSDLAFNNYAAGFATPATGGNVGENYLVSFFSRFNYDYAKKYFLTANIRQDEYSAFGAGRKKGIFYGVGLGWEIAQEEFWTKAGLNNTFTSFKIRGSYGTIGNFNGLGNLASYSFYGTGLYAGSPTLVPTQTGNDQIGWETSDKLDIGFNFGILNDKITVEAAYYKNSLNGLIYDVPQVPSAGLPSTPQINIASMFNKGYELTINADPIRTKDFSWNTSFNFSYNQNEITSLSEGINQFLTTTSTLESASISRVGGPLGMIYAVPTAGVDPATGRRIFIEKATGKKVLYSHNITTSGFLRWSYEDGTAAPVISINDSQIAGNTQPKYVGGFSNNFRFKKFDLSTTMTYQLGFSIYYGTNSGLRDQRFWNNSTDVLRRWTTPGQITDIPKVNFTDNVSNGSSFPIDVNVFKGDFVKLRNVSLGYALPATFLSKAKISSARLYISGDNLVILTKYPGSDPEVSSNGNSTSSLGIERNSVANGRALTAGLTLKF